MTNNILVNRYTDTHRFGEKAEVIEMTLDTPKKMAVAEMHFVIKSGDRCSVSLASGTQAGMAELTADFIKSYRPATLVNQVSNEGEMKAMYRAGLRIPRRPKNLNLKQSLEALVERSSIMMVLEVN
jgi:hypothetical protein